MKGKNKMITNKRIDFLNELGNCYYRKGLNEPGSEESFPGEDLSKILAKGSFETSAYLANKGLVKPWQRNKRIEIISPDEVDKYLSKIKKGNWENDTID